MLKFSLTNIKNKSVYKFIAVLLALALFIPNIMVPDTRAATIAEIESDIKEIEKQQEAHQAEIDRIQAEIDKLAASLDYALKANYVPPQNFYGVGGTKIFRDLIWLMQGMMKADHKFYKAHGQYDFPQKNRGKMLLMYLVGAMVSSPKMKSKMGNMMNEGMLMPYNKILGKKSEFNIKK